VLTESVADFTWALILAITRRLSEGERVVRRGEWKGWALDFMLGSELRGKQLGLVGAGRIGRAVAARAPAFGMKVAYTTRAGGTGAAGIAGAEAMSLDRLLLTSDVVSLHVPLTADTRHLIDQRAFTRMKRSAYLINTARGPVVDEAALAWALQHHLLSGAALDVYENEPAVHPDLLQLENVLLVPHLASGTTETRTAMAALAVSNAIAVLQGPTSTDTGPMTVASLGHLKTAEIAEAAECLSTACCIDQPLRAPRSPRFRRHEQKAHHACVDARLTPSRYGTFDGVSDRRRHRVCFRASPGGREPMRMDRHRARGRHW
jgi:phosphoglycerate dehydrogenase-like enzyme